MRRQVDRLADHVGATGILTASAQARLTGEGCDALCCVLRHQGCPERRHVSRCLNGFGDRLQGSVFELVVDRALFDRCFNQLAQLIDHDEFSIAAYALCESCAGRRATTSALHRAGTHR